MRHFRTQAVFSRAFYLLEYFDLAANSRPNSIKQFWPIAFTLSLSFACNSTVPEIPYSRNRCNPAGEDNSDRVVAVKTVKRTDGRLLEGLFMRQCPNCRAVSSFSSPTCEQCGLRFFKSRLQNLTGTCLRIGGGAILLAAAAIAILRLT